MFIIKIAIIKQKLFNIQIAFINEEKTWQKKYQMIKPLKKAKAMKT